MVSRKEDSATIYFGEGTASVERNQDAVMQKNALI